MKQGLSKFMVIWTVLALLLAAGLMRTMVTHEVMTYYPDEYNSELDVALVFHEFGVFFLLFLSPAIAIMVVYLVGRKIVELVKGHAK